ncbi:MAG: Hint domain-containing protein [Paracoccaceae bacterium]
MPYGYTVDALVYDANSNSWSLKPDYDHTIDRVDIKISDDDGTLNGDSGNNEVGNDANQTANVYDTLGNLTASGQIYDESYFKLTDSTGNSFYLEAMEIGGQVVGWLVTEPLQPGVSYAETGAGNVTAGTTLQYSDLTSVPCYAPGTMISTPAGDRPVEKLRPGDPVLTLDHAVQPVKWIRAGKHALSDSPEDGKPVLIQSHALGPNTPTHDLIVSPQHRILVGGSGQLERYFQTQFFVPAKALTDLPRIRFMHGKSEITWVHFACADHQIITANGCQSESLLLGKMVVNALPLYEKIQLARIFPPAVPGVPLNGPAARPSLSVRQVRDLLSSSRGRSDQQMKIHGKTSRHVCSRPSGSPCLNW